MSGQSQARPGDTGSWASCTCRPGCTRGGVAGGAGHAPGTWPRPRALGGALRGCAARVWGGQRGARGAVGGWAAQAWRGSALGGQQAGAVGRRCKAKDTALALVLGNYQAAPTRDSATHASVRNPGSSQGVGAAHPPNSKPGQTLSSCGHGNPAQADSALCRKDGGTRRSPKNHSRRGTGLHERLQVRNQPHLPSRASPGGSEVQEGGGHVLNGHGPCRERSGL